MRTIIYVQYLLFLNAARTCSAAIDSIDRFIMRMNSKTYKNLERVAEDASYSLIKTKDIGKFSSASKCGLLSCLIRKRSIFGEEYINLLEVREAYTGYKDGSADAWKKIGEVAKMDPLLSILLSGIHYSVSTHLSSFYRKFFGAYISNPSLFLKRFNDSYRINFYFTYTLVRKCIGSIDLKESLGADAMLLRIIKRIKRQGYFPWDEYGQGEIDKSIQRIEEIIELLGHVNCEKCQLWGKIQFEGLKTSLKLLRGSYIMTDIEKFFIVNLFMRLSVSVMENIRLRQYRAPYFMIIALYWMEILSFIASCLIISLISKIRNRTRKTAIFKNNL